MRELLDVQQKLLPDLLEVMQKRYQILQYIRLMQPIGRRSLATSLDLTERVTRSEVSFLKDQGLLHVSAGGMRLSSEGTFLLDKLEGIMKDVSGLKVLEKKVKAKLQLEHVIVVSGDSDQAPWVKKEMGRACASCIKHHATDNNIVAVTGGTTLALSAELMTPDAKEREWLFVPARGGLGEHVENQANTICAKMAEKASGLYRLLHVPDQVSMDVYDSLIQEPSIKEILEVIKSSNIVVHGIGDAMMMAERRNASHSDLNKIKNSKAVGEAFGYYFNESGEVVHKVRTIGLQLEDLETINTVVAVAGGASKAKAIEAYMKHRQDHILITDEGAAKSLVGDLSL